MLGGFIYKSCFRLNTEHRTFLKLENRRHSIIQVDYYGHKGVHEQRNFSKVC